jgi:hypothetical protein
MYTVEKDWTTKAGLRAVVIVVHFVRIGGHRCGYVGVPRWHTLYEKDYHARLEEISAEAVGNSMLGKKSPLLAFTAGVGADKEGEVRRSLDLLIDRMLAETASTQLNLTFGGSASTVDTLATEGLIQQISFTMTGP